MSARGKVAWVPWARFWLTAGDDGTLRCWSPADGRQLRCIACPGLCLSCGSSANLACVLVVAAMLHLGDEGQWGHSWVFTGRN